MTLLHERLREVAPAPAEARRLTGVEFLLPLVAFVALLAVPAWLFVRPVMLTRPITPTVPALVFAVMVVYCAVRLTQLMWQAEPRWMVLGVWMFTYSWIAVAGLTQTLADSNPLNLTLPLPLATVQAGVIMLGLVCFDVASSVRTSGASFAFLTYRVLSPRRTMVLSGISLLSAPLFITVLGGPSVLLSSREAVNDTLTDSGLYTTSSNATGGLIAVFGGVLPFIALLCLLRLLVDDRAVRRRPLPWLFLVGLVAVNVLMNNPISNSRYAAFAVILGFLFSMRLLTRPAVIAVFVTVFAMSALIVFPYLDSFRYSSESVRQYNIQGNNFDQPVDYVLAKTDYGSVTDIAVAIRVTEHQGFAWGRQLLGVATFWVPRGLWPDKPDNTAFLIADEIGFRNRNLDSPLWAEGYVDFGWVGAAAMLGGFGFLARRLDDGFVSLRPLRTTAVPLAAVLVPVVAGYEYILLRGSLLQAMARLFVMVVLLLIVAPRPTARRSS